MVESFFPPCIHCLVFEPRPPMTITLYFLLQSIVCLKDKVKLVWIQCEIAGGQSLHESGQYSNTFFISSNDYIYSYGLHGMQKKLFHNTIRTRTHCKYMRIQCLRFIWLLRVFRRFARYLQCGQRNVGSFPHSHRWWWRMYRSSLYDLPQSHIYRPWSSSTMRRCNLWSHSELS